MFDIIDLSVPNLYIFLIEDFYSGVEEMSEKQIFDDRSYEYDRWFETETGRLVKEYENRLILEYLNPVPGEVILDAGCGTGIFSLEFMNKGSRVFGIDISLDMLGRAKMKAGNYPFSPSAADMLSLPFKDESFDKAVSITALEFIEDAQKAVSELFRVTRKGGTIVVATLNSLSTWANRRKTSPNKGSEYLQEAFFRSPEELCALHSGKCSVRTVVHFEKSDGPDQAREKEERISKSNPGTGALVVARWIK